MGLLNAKPLAIQIVKFTFLSKKASKVILLLVQQVYLLDTPERESNEREERMKLRQRVIRSTEKSNEHRSNFELYQFFFLFT